MSFTEDWFPKENQDGLELLIQDGLPEKGACYELGCWEGKSSVFIAKLLGKRVLHCVDWFKGNIAEGDDHLTVVAAAERDVGRIFLENMKEHETFNFLLTKSDCIQFLKKEDHGEGIAFVYVDASHDYQSVKETLELIKPLLLDGAVVCGDDYESKGVNSAVREAFPDCWANRNFWFHRKHNGNT